MTRGLRVLPSREAIDRLRRSLAREADLYEVRDDGNGAEWCRTDGAAPLNWNPPLALSGAKRFFFPPRETLLTWRGESVEPVVPDVAPFVLFGLRSCDLAAIAYQDRFFATDPWYTHRRTHGLLVGVNCLAPCPGGFCIEVDAGPFAREGSDLNLTPLPDGRVVVEVGTAEGQAALDGASLSGEPANGEVRAAVEVVRGEAQRGFLERPFVQRALARLDADEIADGEWQALGPACFACTGCTNLCPTCSCFTVVDETHDGGGSRTRHWDSCLLEGFQREASGHHPAPRPGDRVRRFWFHKLSRDFPDTSRRGCVGCGRCDVTCAGWIGALSVLGGLGSR